MDLALNTDSDAMPGGGDLVLERGDLTIVEGSASIAQRLRFTLRHFLGEWPLAPGFGLPWYQQILKKNPEMSMVDALLKEAILSTPGVLALERFELSWDRASRALMLSFRVRTDAGSLELAEVMG